MPRGNVRCRSLALTLPVENEVQESRTVQQRNNSSCTWPVVPPPMCRPLLRFVFCNDAPTCLTICSAAVTLPLNFLRHAWRQLWRAVIASPKIATIFVDWEGGLCGTPPLSPVLSCHRGAVSTEKKNNRVGSAGSCLHGQSRPWPAIYWWITISNPEQVFLLHETEQLFQWAVWLQSLSFDWITMVQSLDILLFRRFSVCSGSPIGIHHIFSGSLQWELKESVKRHF